jgi:hypothetical protein
MSVLSLFLFTYAMWGQGVQKLAAERRQRECALRDEKTPVSAS